MAWLSLLSARSRTDILVVCTGNVCRSPYIAALLGAGLPEMTITSAGIRAAVGERPGSDILRALALRNINADFVPSQNVTTRMVRNARLIVTATRMHRVKVVALDPSACARAFTLKELARVTSQEHPGRGLDAVVERGAAIANSGETIDYDDDLADPFGHGWPAYKKMAAEVDFALTVLIPALQSPSGN
jgi:protein-tyrosine phosphatase